MQGGGIPEEMYDWKYGMFVAESYMWMATASTVQPEHAWKNASSHASPFGAAAFVTAGLTSFSLPAY
jgi:hypothetical protein